MLINATQSCLIIGRFSILPGDKGPAVPMTSAETIAVKACLEKKLLVEVASSTEKPAENVDSQ